MTARLREGTRPEPVWCAGGNTPPADGLPILCRFAGAEQVWTNGDDLRVIQPARTYFLSFDAGDFGNFECGGQMMTDVWRSEFHLTPGSNSDPFQLVFDDGSVIELALGDAVAVTGRLYDACSETSGSWHGTTGDLDDRMGTYTMVNDSVQTVLHLVER